MNGKRGISIITLIITIIVVIILVGVLILSLNNTNIIENANKAVTANERANVIDAYSLLKKDSIIYETTKSGIGITLTTAELEKRLGKETGYLDNKFKIEDGILKENHFKYGWVEIGKLPKPGMPTKKPETWTKDNNDIKAVFVKNGDEISIIPVPTGYVVSSIEGENDINYGVVIYESTTPVTDIADRKTKNQYVWVPVDGEKVKYGRVNWKKGETPKGDLTMEKLSDIDLPLSFKLEDINSMITKYKGFYIGRYEASTELQRTSNENVLTKVMCVQDKPAYTYINYNQAVEKSKEAVVLTNVKSGLITGAQWDTALKFIQNCGIKNKIYPVDSSKLGNYQDDDNKNNPAKTGDTRYVQHVFNNIYDMGGNTWEWTNEIIYGTGRAFRGGNCNYSGLEYPAGCRYDYSTTFNYGRNSFRVSLYMK